MKDSLGKEIHAGDRVRYATLGMFDVLPRKETKSTDPPYVTHVELGTVVGLLREGSILIRPDRTFGSIILNTTPRFNVRPEFVEVIESDLKFILKCIK